MLKTLTLAASVAAISGAALAADLPSRRYAPAPAYAPVEAPFAWTGFNVGTVTGYTWTDNDPIRTGGNNNGSGGLNNTQLNVAQGRRPSSFGFQQSGLNSIGGGLGYDYQLSPGNGLVVGVAADATLMDIDRRRAYRSPAQAANTFIPEFSGFRQSLDYLGTVRGRVGYAFDRFLVYGTGGFGYGGVDYRAAFLRNTDNAIAYAGRYNDIATGVVYGGGFEYAIPTDNILSKFNVLSFVGFKTDALTLKVEYLHYDLGHRNVLVSNQIAGGPTGTYTSRFSTEGDIVRGGLTYRFGSLGGFLGGR